NLSSEEQLAFHTMRTGLNDEFEINLFNHVALHKEAIDHLDDHAEESSQKRNQLSGLGYHLNLVLLARRALYVQSNQKLDGLSVTCGEQPMAEYVNLDFGK